MNKETEKLKTFLILKYSSINVMYWYWLVEEIKDITDAEKDIIAEHRGISRKRLESIYKEQIAVNRHNSKYG